MILNNEDLKINTQQTLNKVFKFLNIIEYVIPDLKKRKVGSYNEMQKETRELLNNFYKPYNEKLEKLLDTKFNWN